MLYEVITASERMISVFQPFYATSYRVLRLDPVDEFKPLRSGAITFVLIMCALLVMEMGLMSYNFV